MPWELDNPDRSFQFGRLLAVMERVELDFYYSTSRETMADQDSTDENEPHEGQKVRQTSAIKAMSQFRQHPYHIYEWVNRHLTEAYLPRVSEGSKTRYLKKRGEIAEILAAFSKEELNKPLDDIYLMGYDLQRMAFFKKKNEQGQKEADKPENSEP